MSGSIREVGRLLALLTVAALFEVGGDACIRKGLAGQRAAFAGGAALLVGYGFVVNLSQLDFGKLMGLYIAVFFVVSQVLAVLVFRERLNLSTAVGGSLIIVGACVIQFWQTK